MGFFSAIVLIITWTLNNQQTTTGKGTGVVLLNVVGQCGPLVGVRLFPEGDGPWFVKGMGVSAACMVVVAGLAAALRWWLRVLNRRQRGREREREGVELEDLGGEGEEAEAGEGLMGRHRRGKGGREGEGRFEYIL